MGDIKITPLTPNGDQPVDFYSWGDQSTIGLISKKQQMDEKLEEAFDSIEISEDTTTPETDYVLKVLGKDAGRVVIPFDIVVKDAYYDKETKELVLVIVIGESETKEIRINVQDLIDVYTGDEVTIHVENNVVSITKDVMDKFDTLDEKISEETEKREELGKVVNNIVSALEDVVEPYMSEETNARIEGDEKLTELINDESEKREELGKVVNNIVAAIEDEIEPYMSNETKERKEADEKLQEEIQKVEEECATEPIPLDNISALFN